MASTRVEVRDTGIKDKIKEHFSNLAKDEDNCIHRKP
jgi:hypothetical protein